MNRPRAIRKHLAVAALVGAMLASSPARPQGQPDLVLEVGPPGSPIPGQFIVRNMGGAPSGPSLLKVTLSTVPPDPSPSSALLSLATSNQDLVSQFCKPPYADFVELVPALPPGGMHTAMRPAAPASNVRGLVRPGARHSGLKSAVLACHFDLKVLADANGDVGEANEGNNAVTRPLVREITFE